MIDLGKKNVIGIQISAVDYASAVRSVIDAAKMKNNLSVTALAVHGVMTGYSDARHKARLNSFDLVVPDGQPVRWALNTLHGCSLSDRVYGPTLMLKVCEAAARESLPIYLYGSTEETIGKLSTSLRRTHPGLRIAGAEPSKFRRVSIDETHALAKRIETSGAAILFVGLGCPRQEVFTYELRDALSLPILAVGAAFPFHAGTLAQAPQWMQERGLEWLFRLGHEPVRLWRRYLLLNPYYLCLVFAQLLGRKFSTHGVWPAERTLYG